MLFVKLVFILPEIKDLAYGRHGGRRYLDQVKPPVGGPAECLSDRHHAELFALDVDDPYFSCPYLLVYPNVLTNIPAAYVCTSLEFIFSRRKDINSSTPNGPKFSPFRLLSIT